MSAEWNARSILKSICDSSLRQRVLESFWSDAEDHVRLQTITKLAASLRFRPESVRKATLQKKAELLATRVHSAEFEESLEMALLAYHTKHAKELLSTFLDEWQIPHKDGTIEADEYPVPSEAQVREAVAKFSDRYAPREIALYLATAGMLMGEAMPEWRQATWPVVDEMVGRFSS